MNTQDTTLPPSPVTDAMLVAALKAAGYFDRPQSRKDMRAGLEAAIAAQAPQPLPKDASGWDGSFEQAWRMGHYTRSKELTDDVRAQIEREVRAQQAQGVPAATEYRRGWNECMALWADHMKRMNEALNAPSKVGYFNRAAELHQNVKAALAAAPQAEPAQAQGVPAGHKLLEDGNTAIPADWAPLRLEWEPSYPEDVAFGPQRMMDRLKKWLDRHFATLVAARTRDWMAEFGFEIRHDDNGVWLLVDDCGNEREATLNERVLWDALTAAPVPAAAPQAEPQKQPEVLSGGMVLVSRELLKEAAESVDDYRAGVEFGSCDRKLLGKLKAAAQLPDAATQAPAPQAEPQTPAPAPEPSEERRQLLHLLDDIVEEADQDGATYYRIRDGKDILFSNMVGACARLLAQPEAPAAEAEPLPEREPTRLETLHAWATSGGPPCNSFDKGYEAAREFVAMQLAGIGTKGGDKT